MAERTASQFKRTHFLVDRAYQLRFITRVFMVVLLVGVASAFLSSALLWKNMYQPDLPMQHFIVALLAVASTLLIELILAIPIVFYLGLMQSHRVVGPMNRLKKMLEAIGNGDLSQRITLRQGDALEDLGKSLNQMAEKLQQRFPNFPSS